MSCLVPDPMLKPTISVPRAAEIVGISRRSGYSAVDRGEWPTIRVGGTIRVNTAKFLAKYGLEPTQTEPLTAA